MHTTPQTVRARTAISAAAVFLTKHLAPVVWLAAIAVLAVVSYGQDLPRDLPTNPAFALDQTEPPDHAELRLAAEQGDAEAQLRLGLIYGTGEGVPKDTVEAIRWLRLAAEQRHAFAQAGLGFIYSTGDGVPKDMAEAIRWYRLAAEQGLTAVQFRLGLIYHTGEGVPKDMAEAIRWYRLAAEHGNAGAQFGLGFIYGTGEGVPKDMAEAIRWYRLAAEQGHARAQCNLGVIYSTGDGVPKDIAEAIRWYRLAAEQGLAQAQYNLGIIYGTGDGVPMNYVEAYFWLNLAAGSGYEGAARNREIVAARMMPSQIAEAQRRSAAFEPKVWQENKVDAGRGEAAAIAAQAAGSGFFVSSSGYFVTSHHVVEGARRITIRTASGVFPAEIVRQDPANDLALLKVEGRFSALPVRGSRGVRVGDRVATVGYPNVRLQGTAPKYGSGDIAAVTGVVDDPRFFQISIPIQPGNSGSPLVDAEGRVIGVIAAKLSERVALAETGSLPQNVNYAVKGSFVLNLMESVPELMDAVDGKQGAIPPPDVARRMIDATGLVLVER